MDVGRYITRETGCMAYGVCICMASTRALMGSGCSMLIAVSKSAPGRAYSSNSRQRAAAAGRVG